MFQEVVLVELLNKVAIPNLFQGAKEKFEDLNASKGFVNLSGAVNREVIGMTLDMLDKLSRLEECFPETVGVDPNMRIPSHERINGIFIQYRASLRLLVNVTEAHLIKSTKGEGGGQTANNIVKGIISRYEILVNKPYGNYDPRLLCKIGHEYHLQLVIRNFIDMRAGWYDDVGSSNLFKD